MRRTSENDIEDVRNGVRGNIGTFKEKEHTYEVNGKGDWISNKAEEYKDKLEIAAGNGIRYKANGIRSGVAVEAPTR